MSMTDTEKLSMLKTLLNISDTSEDDLLNVYLTYAKNEIINQYYSITGLPELEDGETSYSMPDKYEMVQINACVVAYNLIGAENELSHSENSIQRVFKYPDMVSYIHGNVLPLVRIIS